MTAAAESHTTYGQKGGQGPTRGRKSAAYTVRLPDGTVTLKRTFHSMTTPTGYAYEHGGKWYVAAVHDADAEHLQHYTKCPVELTPPHRSDND